jgi:hypothetical protein
MKEEDDSVAFLPSIKKKQLEPIFLVFESFLSSYIESLCTCVRGRKCKIWHVVKISFASRDYEAVVPELSSQEKAEPNKQK